VLVLGGRLGAPGWFFFGFGMIFVFIFGDKGDYSSVFVMRGKLETAPAVVTAVENTRFSEGGGKYRKGTPIYAYQYKFRAGQTNYEGTCYATGQKARVGSEVTVEFPLGWPDRSRIQGMRRAMFGPVIAVVFLFPAIVLALLLSGVVLGCRNIRLLANGETARGTLLSQAATNMRVNRRTVYKMTFQFTDLTGQLRQAVVKSSTLEKLQTSPFEFVFYDRNDPTKATLLDDLPGHQGLTNRGEIRPCGIGSMLGATVAPLFALVVIMVGMWLKVMR